MDKIRQAIVAIVNEKKNLRQTTQVALAKEIGCSPNYLSMMLNGDRRISSQMLVRICDALGVKLSDLENWNPELAKIRFSTDNATKDVVVSGSVAGNNILGVNFGTTGTGVNYGPGVARNRQDDARSVARHGQERSLSAEAAELLRIYESLDLRRRVKILDLAVALEEDAEKGKQERK